jgi:hypothetical protein
MEISSKGSSAYVTPLVERLASSKLPERALTTFTTRFNGFLASQWEIEYSSLNLLFSQEVE